MRILDEDFKKMFTNEYKGIIDYVKEHDEVFLGIRHNSINLYVDGGSFLRLSYDRKTKKCIGKIDEKYFDDNIIKKPVGLDYINNRIIVNIQDWINLFDSLVLAIQKYQNGEYGGKDKTKIKREKIIQQKLVKEFNLNSNYIAYDIEYAMGGVNDYVLDANYKKIPLEKGYRTKALGRADIMLIALPKNDKIKVYFMEVKEGTGAFGGVLPDKSKNRAKPSFGSGIVGHLKNNVALINAARSGEDLLTKDGTNHHAVRDTLLKEIKYALLFYKEFDLIKNKKFKALTKEDINNIEISDDKDSVELVFYLADYKDLSLEKYLGINLKPEQCSSYSVKNLLNNKKSNEINLDYINQKDLFDFKVIRTQKKYSDSSFDLEIEKYDIIHANEFSE